MITRSVTKMQDFVLRYAANVLWIRSLS